MTSQKDRPLLLGSSSGLCNRLRELSYWLTRSNNIRMLWPVNTACPASWGDLFEPLKEVQFIRSTCREANRYKRKLGNERSFTLNDLVPRIPTPEIREPYIALHVRRTDLVSLKKRRGVEVETNEVYFDFIEKSGVDLIYLATDSQKTQGEFKRQFGDRLIYHQEIKGYGSSRKPVRCTSVKHAVVDLYTCSRATYFLGTQLSSFTGFIQATRDANERT
jgi:hypothetical protein